MSAWVETSSPNFAARFDEVDRRDVRDVLNLLEDMRERLEPIFPALPEEVSVVLHTSRFELDLAQPYLPILRRLTTPAARRYLAGWAAGGTVHVLAPRLLAARAANVEGSKKMLLLTPAALYVQLAIAACNPDLPPPWSPRSTVRAARWAWLVAGSAQWFSGQTALARPAIARRLRDEARPEFPPALKDATLLGGSLVDLVAREQGAAAAARLAYAPLPPGGPRQALLEAFGGRALVHTEGTWRAHLARLAGQ
ncbi:MAG TPA: hypothetical protein VGO80_24205 [Solirubrobacteraceae bacterium]|jgi:hypothetical protein|nr:hypothetical protein [Solirubrobacteraceae bacterium]